MFRVNNTYGRLIAFLDWLDLKRYRAYWYIFLFTYKLIKLIWTCPSYPVTPRLWVNHLTTKPSRLYHIINQVRFPSSFSPHPWPITKRPIAVWQELPKISHISCCSRFTKLVLLSYDFLGSYLTMTLISILAKEKKKSKVTYPCL